MPWGVVINLDYEHHSQTDTRQAWEFIHKAMLEAGFISSGRLFISISDSEETIDLARDTLDSLESHLDYHSKRIYRFVKEFYAFDLSTVANLMLPPKDSIIVSSSYETRPAQAIS